MNNPETHPSPNDHPHVGMHICPECSGQYVQQKDWWEVGSMEAARKAITKGASGEIVDEDTDAWAVKRECPECEWRGEGIYGTASIEAYDRIADAGQEQLIETLEALTEENMMYELSKIAVALEADLVYPEDIRYWRHDPAADYEPIRLF